MNRRSTGILLLALLLAAPLARAETIALTGGTVHPVSGPVIETGTVLMSGGKIVSVREGTEVPQDIRVVDVTGLHVYPGMISASTLLGLYELGSVAGTRDGSETGDVNPNLRTKVALNPDSELIPVTRANGVLTVLTAPQGGILAGRSVVWNLDGWTWEDFTVLDDAALHIRWPAMSSGEARKQSEERVAVLTGAFEDARAYRIAREAMAAGGSVHPEDVRWEAMLPVLRGERPVFVHADEMQQIEAALDFAVEQDVRVVIVGGRDAPRLAERLAAEEVAVVLDRVTREPRRSFEPYDAAYTPAARLHEAGVRFCIAYGSGYYDVANTRNLPYEAAMAAAFGLPREEALKAVTLYPAEILGVGDRLGSLEEGKDANVIVTTGDPLEIRTNVVRAFIGGREVDLGSRHTDLYEKYRNRPRSDDGESRLEPSPGGR